MMTTVLVIGATGALGRAITARLREDGDCDVLGTTRGAAGPQLLSLDLHHRHDIEALLARTRPDVVLQLAASFGDDFAEAYATNVQGAQSLLECIERSGRRPRVVLLGSAAEYGAVRPEDNPVREDRSLAPVSIYGLTKAWQSTLAPYFAARGVEVVVARVFNLEGPGLSDALFIGRLQKQIEEIRRGSRTTIELGALSATRDYVAMDVAVEQILAIARHGIPGSVYHVASGVPVTVREVLMRYLAQSGLDHSIVRSRPELSGHRGVDVPVIYADMTRTSRLPAWRARA